MKNNKISIALCTFNGARHLNDQLTSFLRQARRPDEVIICDDGSSDQTISIIKAFSRSSPFTVRIFINRNRLGPTRNFDKAVGLCTGDLIALSDQDDVWHPHKLERCERLLNERPELGAVFTNAEITDGSLRSLGYGMWDKTKFTPQEQLMVRSGNALIVLLKHYVVTGATLMFRSRFKSVISPIPDFWFHDAWIALMISALSFLDFIAEPMMKYRQHPSNHLGENKNG